MFCVHKAKPNELQLLLKERFNIDEKNANGGQEKKKFKYSVAGKKGDLGMMRSTHQGNETR